MSDMGRDLASAYSQEENDFVRELIESSSWMGFNDTDLEGTWVWSGGSSVDYTNWNLGEPNDLRGEDCGEIYYKPGYSRVNGMIWDALWLYITFVESECVPRAIFPPLLCYSL